MSILLIRMFVLIPDPADSNPNLQCRRNFELKLFLLHAQIKNLPFHFFNHRTVKRPTKVIKFVQRE